MSLLEIRHLSLQICRQHSRIKKILRSINFSVLEKGVVVILGPSGTGKSTLLRTLASLNERQHDIQVSGEIIYHGCDLFNSPDHPALVQQKLTHLTLSVKENILSHLPDRASIMLSEQHERISGICEEYGQLWLLERLNLPVAQLERYQQRILAIICTMLSRPKLLMLDEPTADLSDADALLLHDVVRKIALKIPVLIVSHHLAQTRKIADRVMLLANGYIQEQNDVENFFQYPQKEITKQYLRTGSCAELSEDELDVLDIQNDAPSFLTPAQVAQDNSEDIAPFIQVSKQDNQAKVEFDVSVENDESTHFLIHDANAKSQYRGPRGFVWLLHGKLAGTPSPGISREVETDLNYLKNVGVTDLISLTEEIFSPVDAQAFAIQVSHYPIVDMHAPSIEIACRFCRDIDQKISDHKVIAIHCKAGLGRTGTMLAVYYLWLAKGGRTAQQAITYIRSLNHLMIQSSQQTDFLDGFYLFLKSKPEFLTC